jgi:hypothetical protein
VTEGVLFCHKFVGTPDNVWRGKTRYNEAATKQKAALFERLYIILSNYITIKPFIAKGFDLFVEVFCILKHYNCVISFVEIDHRGKAHAYIVSASLSEVDRKEIDKVEQLRRHTGFIGIGNKAIGKRDAHGRIFAGKLQAQKIILIID